MNTYLKYIIILVASATVGGIGGACSPALLGTGLGGAVQAFVQWVCRMQFPILLTLFLAEILILEYVLFDMKKRGSSLYSAEDEESDRLDYEIEKMGSIGVAVSNVAQVLFLLIISTGYSIEYMNSLKDQAENWYLASLGLFIIGCFYVGIWQIRYVKAVQKIYPDKKGDPVSKKFRKQWLESCDEAEKELIYQSSYESYQVIMKVIPVVLLLSMVGHLIWNTGIMAVFVVGVIWVITSITYSCSVVRKKGQRLNKE